MNRGLRRSVGQALASLLAPARAMSPAPGAVPQRLRKGDRFEFDEEAARSVTRVLDPIFRYYFRAEVRGTERFPQEQTMLVCNHDGGMLPIDGLIIGSAWHHRFNFKRPLHILVHDMVLRFAGGLRRIGAVLADRHNLDRVMDAGHSVLIYPGASRETFRPFWERKRITLGDRTGFIRHALRRRLLLTPVVSAGVHETFFVLARGTWFAELTGMRRLFRADVFPIVAGLPLGVWLGATFPQLPLPAKITAEVLEPIDVVALAEQLRGRPLIASDLDDPVLVGACFNHVRERMQAALDRLYAERRLPIIG